MFKKLLAGIGINSAKVDLQLEQDRIKLGGLVKGQVVIEGGSVDQELDELTISLVITSEYKHGDALRSVIQKVAEVKVCDKMFINAGSPAQAIPIQFKLPYNIPISHGKTNYYFETSLEIKNAIDPTDKDYIQVLPNKHTQMLFDAISSLGFRLKPRSGEYNGKFQQFEYRPTTFMRGQLDEIELYFEAHENRINAMLQVDKRNTGLFGSLVDDLDLDERYTSFTLDYDNMQNKDQVAAFLSELITNEYRKI